MNQQQRKFLIDKINESLKGKIKLLEESKPKQPPSLSSWLLSCVLSDNFTIRSNEEIRELIKKKARENTSNNNWMGGGTYDHYSKSVSINISFEARELFDLPDGYTEQWDIYRAKVKEVDDEIRNLTNQKDVLTTRIQLASDKVLDRMISEVDDMGDISFMDMKLRSLGGNTGKLLGDHEQSSGQKLIG